MRKAQYANAKNVLPPDVLKTLQQYCSGIQLWIPPPKRIDRERKEFVIRLHADGFAASEIARRTGVTVRRVQQIITGGDPNMKIKRILALAVEGTGGAHGQTSKKKQNASPAPRRRLNRQRREEGT